METKSIHKIIVLAIAVLLLTIALPAAVLALQTYAGAGAGTTTGGGGQFVSIGGTGGGNTQTFSLGSGFRYSMTSVNPDDVASLKSSGARVVTEPAGTNVYVTTSTGEPTQITTGQGPANMIVFGPAGFVGTSAYAGAGQGPGAGITGGGISVGPGGATQMYSFTGSPGQAFLITQQSGGNTDRVLVEFQ